MTSPPSSMTPPSPPAILTRIPPSNPHALSESASVLLDLVRLTAAIVVVVGHLTFAELNTGFPDLHVIGEYAVPVFFVLSGFVIRFVTRSREHSLRVFLVDRASRMYSIMLPAILLTLLVSGLCLLIDREHYLAVWGAVSDHVLARVLLNLTFLSQSWGHNVIPLVDAPFWSLSYECLYYIAYGLLFFLSGWKRILAVALWAVIAGPQVLFLFPIWWLGCWVYDLYHHLRGSALARALALATLACTAVIALLTAIGNHLLLHAALALAARFVLLPHPLEQLHQAALRATWNTFGTGLTAGLCMLLLLFVSDLITISRRNIWARRFRRVADGTFAIYLMHYPLLVLALFVGLLRPSTHARSALVATLICMLLIGISGTLDRLKGRIRNLLHHRFVPSGSAR